MSSRTTVDCDSSSTLMHPSEAKRTPSRVNNAPARTSIGAFTVIYARVSSESREMVRVPLPSAVLVDEDLTRTIWLGWKVRSMSMLRSPVRPTE